MTKSPSPDEIVQAIRDDLHKDARELGEFIEIHSTRPEPLSRKVKQDLEENAPVKQSLFEGAEEGQKAVIKRERES